MPAAPNLGFAFGLEPKEAVAYFQRLGYQVTDDWFETAEAVRGKAFAAAKSGSLDVLKDLKEGLIQAARTGETEAGFIGRMGEVLQAKGWEPNNPSRLKTIFRTNMQSAYMAGRWEQFQASKDTRPFLQYVAVMDAVTRPSHAAMNKLVFRIDDPIWKTHYPPCGYNCRCRVRSLSAASLKAQKLEVLDSSGDTFTEVVEVGKGRRAEIAGYRTPAKPVRVAQKDSAPGAYPKVERGQAMLWEPTDDPKFVDGEGPDWKLDVRRVAMRTDPGFGFNQGRWDPAGDLPDVPAPGRAGQVLRAIDGQPTWRDAGRPDIRNVATSERVPQPPMLPEGKTRPEALQILAEALQVSESRPFRTVRTPVELVRIDYEKLTHVVESAANARERYGLYMLATLAEPFEVYLTEYTDGFRTRYIGLFEGDEQLLVVARINKDGTVLWNFFKSSDLKYINKQREGELLYFKEGT